jgi:hypothetical protein
MMRAWVTCAVALMVLGCQSREEPVRGAHRGIEPNPVEQPESRPPARLVDTPKLERRASRRIVVGTTEEEPERDLGAELNAKLGTPSDCVRDFSASSPTTIRISVSGIVRPTGMIIQPNAYGSALSGAALQCIEKRVGLVVLKPLDDTVSQTASTVIEIKYQPPVIVESDPGVPEPHLKDVRDSLPKRPHLPPSGKRIDGWPTSDWISGGFDGGRPIQKPTSKKIKGPKPRAIDGYDVDENAQDWD